MTPRPSSVNVGNQLDTYVGDVLGRGLRDHETSNFHRTSGLLNAPFNPGWINIPPASWYLGASTATRTPYTGGVEVPGMDAVEFPIDVNNTIYATVPVGPTPPADAYSGSLQFGFDWVVSDDGLPTHGAGSVRLYYAVVKAGTAMDPASGDWVGSFGHTLTADGLYRRGAGFSIPLSAFASGGGPLVHIRLERRGADGDDDLTVPTYLVAAHAFYQVFPNP